MMMRSILFLLSSMIFAGCVSLQSVSQSSIPAKKGREITAQAGKVIILGFNFDNDYVDAVSEDLKRQCPQGKISGILTKDEAIHYFLFFVWKRQVTATGYCESYAMARKTANDASEQGTNP